MSDSGERIPVAILGASGYIGQHFLRLLAEHPRFSVEALVGSERSTGRTIESIWHLEEAPPARWADQRLRARTPAELVRGGIRLVFSGLPSGTAGPVEDELARRGLDVFTNAADHRMDPRVPLLVPEVNSTHLLALARRPRERGLIVADPNCSAAGLVVALRPVWDLTRPSAVHVVTYQALSGAGVPGVTSLSIADNVVPFIGGEEEKLVAETQRMLGGTRAGRTRASRVPFAVHCARVGVRDGHLEAVTIVARERPALRDLERAWSTFDPLAGRDLPTAPHPTVILRREADRPQPLRDRWAGAPPRARGMAVSVGRVRWKAPFLRFFALSHNAVRGGAGGSVLNAELALDEGLLGRARGRVR
ncbi:MAG: aspartate-semialdehyde dehydrogenase [Thermoplasmata archaeon]